MPNGIYYSNLLLKLYLKSLKFDGALKFNDYIPYDENMIATITNLNIDTVRTGLKVLSSMKFIERLDDGTIYMMNIQSFIGKSNNEADRKKAYREKIVQKKLKLKNTKEDSSGQVSAECPRDDETSCELFEDECPKDSGTKCGLFEDECTKDSGTNCAYFLDERTPERETIVRDKSIDIRDKDRDRDITSQSVDIINNFEKFTGSIGALNLAAVKSAIKIHGVENVKMAIYKAIERNKITMFYINGILKNWANEGYPEGECYFGNRSFGGDNEAG